MNAVIIFDVNSDKELVISGLKGIGYYDYWSADIGNPTINRMFKLPEGVLWSIGKELEIANSEINAVISGLNRDRTELQKIKLNRCLILSANPWVALPEEIPPSE